MSNLDINAIRQRVNAATTGPWEHGGNDGMVWPPRMGDPVSGSTETADAEFIAHARTDVPALLAEVETLRAQLAGRDAAIERHHAEEARLGRHVDSLERQCDEQLQELRQQRGEVNTYAAAIAHVAVLHQQYRGVADVDSCAHCSQVAGHHIPFPCLTVEGLRRGKPTDITRGHAEAVAL